MVKSNFEVVKWFSEVNKKKPPKLLLNKKCERTFIISFVLTLYKKSTLANEKTRM